MRDLFHRDTRMIGILDTIDKHIDDEETGAAELADAA